MRVIVLLRREITCMIVASYYEDLHVPIMNIESVQTIDFICQTCIVD